MAGLYKIGCVMSNNIIKQSSQLFRKTLTSSVVNVNGFINQAETLSIRGLATQSDVKEKAAPAKKADGIKRPISAFNVFTKEYAEQLRSEEKTFVKKEFWGYLSETWNGMTDADKLPYQKTSLKDKERYAIEKEEHQKSLGPVKPKKALSSYMWFVTHVMKDQTGSDLKQQDRMKLASERWNSLSAAGKKPFENLNEKDKTRYEEEFRKYEIERAEFLKENPEKPKKVLSAYNFFTKEFVEQNKSIPGVPHLVGIGEEWKKLDAKARLKYEDLSEKDMSRHKIEMAAFMEKQPAAEDLVVKVEKKPLNMKGIYVARAIAKKTAAGKAEPTKKALSKNKAGKSSTV